MVASILLTVVMVLAITFWTATQNNRSAAADSVRMVSGGLKSRIERLASLNYDYAAWDAAFQNALARDMEWLYENMGIAANGNEFHLLQIVFPDDWSSLTWTVASNEEGPAPLAKPVVPIEIVQDLAPALRAFGRDVQDTQTTFVEIDGIPHSVVLSRIQPWGKPSDIPMESFPILVFGLSLDDAFLSDLASTFLIESIRLGESQMEGHLAIALEDPAGGIVTRLNWVPPRPGDALVRAAFLPLSVGLTLFLLLNGLVTLQARKNAEMLVASEAEAVRTARKDVMTGLSNRLALNEFFVTLRRGGHTVCTAIVDLNDFKSINDVHGHHVGDTFVLEFASRIRDSLPASGFAARLGGDEFAIVIQGSDAEAECLGFCQALKASCADPIACGELVLDVSYAVGFSIGDASDVQMSELLRRADVAMYHAKQRRFQGPVKYEPQIEKDKIDEEMTIQALKESLVTCEAFDVQYQPIVDVRTGQPKAAEALVRWHMPALGDVPPSYFIPIAERTSLVVEIGQFVMRRVFSDMARFAELNVSINLSPVQLREAGIVSDILELSKAHAVDPSRVTFEITETALIEDEDHVLFVTDSLREAGFKIALDDFGTGYSSIGYLRRMRFDKLKVDKSFIDDIGVTETGENLLTSLRFLSRALRLEIIAEGVETIEQLDLLRSLSFDMAQGCLLSEPMSVSDIDSWIDGVRGSGVVSRASP